MKLEDDFKIPSHRKLVVISIMMATLLYSIDWTIGAVALPHQQGAFSATEDQITWIITSYIVASAILMPLSGWASEKLGRKRLMICTLIGFTISSYMCGAANSLEFEIFSRILQGGFGAFILPLSNSIILDSYPREEHGKAISLWSMGAFSGAVLGPSLGGFLTEHISWRYIYFINLPIGAIALFGVIFFMTETKKEKRKTFSWTGFFMLSLAVGSLQLMIDRGERLDWFESTEILIEFLIMLCAIYLFCIHTITSKNPFLEPRLLKNYQFVIGLVLISLYGLLTVPIFIITPVFMTNLLNYPIDTVGYMQMPRGIGLIAALFVAGRISGKVNPKIPICIGLCLLFISTTEMAFWNLDVSGNSIVRASLLQGIGAGIIIIPFQEIAFYGLASKIRTEASSILQLTRTIFSGVGISISIYIYVIVSGVSRSELVNHINIFKYSSIKLKEDNLNLSFLEKSISDQASLIGYNAAFLFISIISAISLVIILFTGKLRIGAEK